MTGETREHIREAQRLARTLVNRDLPVEYVQSAAAIAAVHAQCAIALCLERMVSLQETDALSGRGTG